jgi:hypothetical protein
MRTWFISISMNKNNFIATLTLLFTLTANAKTAGMVERVYGKSFLFDEKGQTFSIFKGAKIREMSEIRVEEGSQLTIHTPENHYLHLASGTHVKFLDRAIEIKSGYVWLQSLDSKKPLKVQTANSMGQVSHAEAVYSFDEYHKRSQLMVITGRVPFANIFEEELVYEVTTGQFSILENKLNDGIPRQPTNVGKSSFHKITSVFEAVKPKYNLFEQQKPRVKKQIVPEVAPKLVPTSRPEPVINRSLASVKPVSKKEAKGQIVFIDSTDKNIRRVPASAAEYYESLKTPSRKKKASRRVVLTGKVAPIRVFGPKAEIQKEKVSAPKMLKSVERLPASIPSEINEKTNLVQELQRTSTFESSLQNQLQKQKRHTDEKNRLIDELKSFDQAYQKEY